MLRNCEPTCDNTQWFVDEGLEPQVWHHHLGFLEPEVNIFRRRHTMVAKKEHHAVLKTTSN